ncbi:MAG: response regulator [Acidobacteriota bacterium]
MVQDFPRPRLLLVDDNPDNLTLLRLFLEQTQYDLDEAANGSEAVERFQATPYDLVLMDLEMPEVDGYEATRRMRELEQERQSPPVPILALTAHALDEHRLRCLEAGFTDFMVKPVRKATMLRTLLAFLGEGAAPHAPRSPLPELADPGRLTALLPFFFDTSEQGLAEARQALAQGDLETVRRQGHRLKGSAGSYGFGELGEAAAALEQAGGNGEREAAQAALERATALLAKARLDWPA